MTISADEIGERALRQLGVAIIPLADRPALTTMVAPAAVATGVLIELGVIASDETPSATDQALALEKVVRVQDSLASQALVWWSNDGIPQAIAEEVTKMAAAMTATAFGKKGDLAAYTALEARVRQMALILSSPDHATAAVLDVHNEMDAAGLVRWSSQDIPHAISGAYEDKAAFALAPLFGKAGDVRAAAEATRRFARYSALPSSDTPTPVDYF